MNMLESILSFLAVPFIKRDGSALDGLCAKGVRLGMEQIDP